MSIQLKMILRETPNTLVQLLRRFHSQLLTVRIDSDSYVWLCCMTGASCYSSSSNMQAVPSITHAAAQYIPHIITPNGSTITVSTCHAVAAVWCLICCLLRGCRIKVMRNQ
jgi:hypothetical protein